MNQFIDPDTATRSTAPFNLTHYFRQMSLGQFHVVGEALWVESSHSQEEYRNGSFGRANTDILADRVDSLVDFSLYDNWKRVADYTHVEEPDSIVDMIIMVWRTTMFEFIGEASLGYKPPIPVDGKRIAMGYPAHVPLPVGSGVTCEYQYGDDPQHVMRTMVHEVGHWLLGLYHPYNGLKPDGKFQFWGILCPGQRTSVCANAYDRERLGWITPAILTPGTTLTLGDFVTTGEAGKYHPANGEPFEYFYLENHQRLSVLDDITVNWLDRGLWVLHQQAPYLESDNFRILPSDGTWEWPTESATSSCFGSSIPVFSRGEPMVAIGRSHRDQLVSSTSLLNWLLAYRGPEGGIACGSFFEGEGFQGAFDTLSASVFSPSSNPGSHTWSHIPTTFACEVISEEDGVLTIAIPADPSALAPARRYLGVHPGTDSTQEGSLLLAWGEQWSHGQRLEPDVMESVLERRVNDDTVWTPVFGGAGTSWRDTTLPYDTTGTLIARFRVRVSDNQGKHSAWSNEYLARFSASTDIEQDAPLALPRSDVLASNFPNPFNPHTTIRFRLHSGGWTAVEVYDVLGRLTRTLVRRHLSAGTHEVTWDGRDENRLDVAGGVYVYRIAGETYTASRTMLLLR
jgi:M6 family metalloprotease-like protein